MDEFDDMQDILGDHDIDMNIDDPCWDSSDVSRYRYFISEILKEFIRFASIGIGKYS